MFVRAPTRLFRVAVADGEARPRSGQRRTPICGDAIAHTFGEMTRQPGAAGLRRYSRDSL